MSRRLTRISLVLVLLLSSKVWAIGLGDIHLDSALNEPLRAEIELLSATLDELDELEVTLASSETFARYGIDRPFFLQDIAFNIDANGPNGPIVQLRSRTPITEPFLTFLVEANWPSGRLLREYTVLLDPPTFAPPAIQESPAVTAPRRSAPSDSARIERQQPAAPAPQQAPDRAVTRPLPAPPPSRAPEALPEQQPTVDTAPYETRSGGDYVVQRRETLWGIASRMRPDARLTMNQTMLAIFQANPEAFGGNINLLKAGASLRIPSADEVFQITRGDALSEVQRQHSAWGGGADYTAPPQETRPSLILVPPDEEPPGLAYDDDLDTAESLTREQEIENRIAELESADVPDQPSLIDIRDNELATLRQELANIRGEVYEPVVEDIVEDPFVDETTDDMADDAEAMDDEVRIDDLFPDQDELAADADDETAADDEAAGAEDAEAPSTTIRTAPPSEPGIVDQIFGILANFWTLIIAALVVVAGLLFWLMRRGSGDEDDSGPWETLDADEIAAGAMSATESLRAPTPDDDSIVVVEQDSAMGALDEDTAEVPIAEVPAADTEDTGTFGSLEDTFSSETAVNLDQTDPIAEADFHMAYGLYDQAADLINGALESEPSDSGLMAKLCEIYFVWGNRDAFIDAAGRLKSSVGDGESPEWDKIVIMGQQIAADHALFAGAGVAAATKEMDLSFEAEMDEAGALDMDFGGDAGSESDIIDLGAEDSGGDEGGVDFLFEDTASGDDLDMSLEPTAESPTIESPGATATVEMPAPDKTVETPTIEQLVEGTDGTSELPSLEETFGQESSATAEINLDDLDLDIDGLAETELASLDDIDVTGANEALDDTGINEMLEDTGAVTGKNPEIDPSATGVREGLDLGDLVDLDATGEMRLAPDETGASPMLDPLDASEDATDIGIDDSLLDATGLTQVLSDDFAVETAADVEEILGDDQATMLASLDEDDDGDFDFAKTEALPQEAFTGNADLDATGEMPAVAETDVDLDLDDLTAALQVSEAGDTIEQLRDDATVEQPRPSMGDETAEVATMSLAPEDMSDDLHEARTMTEVGTKLDLARAYVDMGDPAGARSILEEVLDEGDESQRQQAQQLLETLPS